MPRKTLTRAGIVEAAIELADESGVDALTMRALAQRLGAGAMSLYGHVANKDELLAAMVDEVCTAIHEPCAAGSEGAPDRWRHELRRCAVEAHEVLLAHPWAAPAWTSAMPGPVRTRLMEAILRSLAMGGLSDELVYRGYHAVTMHIVGFTIQVLGYRSSVGDAGLEAAASAFLDGAQAERLPHLVDHVRAHLDERHDHDEPDEFTFVLDLLLDGLERS